MKKTVLILEDEVMMQKALCKLVQSCDEELRIHCFSDRKEAFMFAMDYGVDIFFVDIILEPADQQDFSGIQFARDIRSCSRFNASEIVFITAVAGLEIELLHEVHCFDYIQKPFSDESVKRIVKAVLQKLGDKNEKENEVIFLRKNRISFPIHTKDIVYVKGRGKDVLVYMKNEEICFPYMSLNRLLSGIRAQKFLMPKRGMLLNTDYIEYVDKVNRYVKMKGIDKQIEISSKRRAAILHEYFDSKGKHDISH
ncbi:MAG: LytTR family transcriptional regulator DNA-binding domain-containing protein [Lachnospiraceae bacterium]|nr:LytTR family transcriptional regulator DNA-binding domain-containing protein [Lachnospiraceae bacterium]